MDRLGDLACTLPVDQHPKLTEGGPSVRWIVSKGLEPILDCAQPKRSFWSFNLKFSMALFWEVVRKIKVEHYDKVILFYAPWWIAFACLVAGIPDRYSPRSRWFQVLFFNRTLRQTRSRSEKHEAEYNWDLIHWALTGEQSSQAKVPFLALHSTSKPKVILPQHYVVLHPGMGGSALNWPSQNYIELAQILVAHGKSIVVTGTPGDIPWLKDLEQPLKALPKVHWMVGEFDLKTLIYVLSQSEATVAPSTGVLHLAASTGVKTLGIYSPIRVQTPTRWGPRGERAKAFLPDVECPASTHCLGNNCKEYPCLEKLSSESLLAEILKP
jgi:ADP-heptose:LPS heptosyltransferase